MEYSNANTGIDDFPLHLAASEGRIMALDTYLASAPELLDSREHDHGTILHCAIIFDQPEIISYLLRRGADPALEVQQFAGNGGVLDFNDAITMAAVHGKVRALDALLDFGVEIPANIIENAASVNQVESIRLMLTRSPLTRRHLTGSSAIDCIHQALVAAATCWHLETTCYLSHELSGFHNLQREEDRRSLQQAIDTALVDHVCCEFCRDRSSRQKQFLVVQELVEAGGDLSEHSIWTALNPLHTAHLEIARALGCFMIACGTNISTTNEEGITPLAAAARDLQDDDSLVSALVAAGASMISCTNGNTPLHCVYQPSILRILLEAGALVTARNNFVWTLLISIAGNNEWGHVIAPQNRVQVCRLLVTQDSEINPRANDGTTALHRAVKAKDEAIARYLLENGADVTLLSRKGQSVLHYACMAAVSEESSWNSYGRDVVAAVMQTVSLLISCGADLEARGIEGRTPVVYTLKGYIPEAKRDAEPTEWSFDRQIDERVSGLGRTESQQHLSWLKSFASCWCPRAPI